MSSHIVLPRYTRLDSSMESAAIASDNPTTTPESSVGPATPVAVSSPTTSPPSSTSSQKRKREEDEEGDEGSDSSTTTPPRARAASVAFSAPGMWGFGYISSIWKTIVDWSCIMRPFKFAFLLLGILLLTLFWGSRSPTWGDDRNGESHRNDRSGANSGNNRTTRRKAWFEAAQIN